MRHRCKLLLSGTAIALTLAVRPAAAEDYSFLGDWPTHYTLVDGTDFGATGLYQYDLNDFSHDDGCWATRIPIAASISRCI